MKSANGSTNLNRSTTVGIVALLAVVTGWVGVTALHAGQSPSTPGIVVRESRSTSEPRSSLPASGGASESAASLPSAPSAAEIVVHVAGAVKKPGVYHLKPGARNIDAVDAAGGFTAAANSDAINLAALSVDSSQIYIPTRTEQPSGGSASQPGGATTSSVSPSLAGVASARSGDAGKGVSHSSHSSNKFSDPSQGQVNLNTADAAQLQHIPGVGPAMAERILAYRRTAGRFQSTDEILQISGIGDKKYQKMKPFMTVR